MIMRAKNGNEALDLVSSQRVDLVLMDMKMPVLDGYKATRQLKQTHASIPFVAVTAYAMVDEKEFASKSGCDDYLAKPLKKEFTAGNSE